MIEVNDLTKEFDGLKAVDNINLEVKESELFGLLGPNGAGKTTLVHMLSTVLPPTSGSAKVAGYDIRTNPDEVRSSIGIVFQDQSLDERLTGFENLDFHGRMYGIPEKERKEKSEELLEMVDLEDRGDSLVKEYSGGMRRRLELARGFLHDPQILFLDEPTLGLDPQTRRKIWNHIQELNEIEKTTMILTTHYMEEADHLCQRVGIIDRGEIIALDSPEKLKNELKGDIITLETSEPEKLAKSLEKTDYVSEINREDEKLYLRVENGESVIPKLLNVEQKTSAKIKSVGLRKPTLEDVFIDYTGRRIREEEAGAKERMRMKRGKT